VIVGIPLLDKLLAYLLQPFSSGTEVLKGLTTTVRAFGYDLNSKTALPYLLTSLAIAWLIHRQRKGAGDALTPSSFRQFVFPREVYLHPSALIDYKFVAIDMTIKSFLYVPAITAASWGLYKVLASLLGLSTASTAPQPLTVVSAAVTLAAGVLLADFGFFVSHYLMHKVPLLWHFHQTHHSAEVLTPVTVYRIHPVEDMVNAFVGSVLTALGAAAYAGLSSQEVRFGTILGVNGILFFYYVFAFQLRHSHVWLSYGPVLSRVLISPAQHQVHHSKDERHWDRNFGFTFAVWDWMCGTLYVPLTREKIEFGIPGANAEDFATVGRMYFRPFRRAMESLRFRKPVPLTVPLQSAGQTLTRE
jgi:sterol desaturase/sphingolipid hydroxylase (fatty acid hydroxylase superfamily)